jgi:hypothetical protein
MSDVGEQVKDLIEEWDGKQGHDKCHYYPEIFRAVAAAVGAKLRETHDLPPLQEFQVGCRQQQDELYGAASDDTWLDHLIDDISKVSFRNFGHGFSASAKRDLRDVIKRHLRGEREL